MATDVAWSELRRAIDLDEVENALGIEVTRVGDEDVASCPLPSHSGQDEHPSFSINNRTYAWNCFACGLGGPLFKLVQEMLGLDYDGAIEWLRPHAGELTPGDTKWLARIEKKLYEPVERPKMVRKPELPYFAESRIERWISQVSDTDYLKSRGLSWPTIRRFKLGYDPAYRGHRWTAPAVVIPHFFQGDLVGWQVRCLADEKPKYDNSDDFPKKDTLYNWDMTGKYRGVPLLVVESPFTVMKLYQYGYLAVATFGASISDRQIELLSTRDGPLWLSYDNDEAGQGAVKRLSTALSEYRPVDVVPTPEGEKADLDNCTEAEVGALVEARKPSFLTFT